MPDAAPPSTLQNAIDEHLPGTLLLLQELVEISSGSLEPRGVNRVGNMLATRFEKLGFEAEQEQAADSRCGKHLFLHKPGTGDATILFVGHLDTVYSVEELERHNFHWREEGDRIYGPGTVDMKGGSAMIWLVLKALRQTDPDLFDAVNWHVHFNAAEEILAPDFSQNSIDRLANHTCAALIFEYGSSQNGTWQVVTGRKARATINIQIEGKSAHGGYPREGANAIRQLAELIPEIESMTDTEPGLTANVGKIRGGEACNIVPGFAEADLEIRARDSATLDAAVAKIHAWQGRGTVGSEIGEFVCRIRVELRDRVDAWAPDLTGTGKLLEIWQQAGEQLDLTIDACERSGFSDGNFFAAAGIPTLDGLGPDGGNLHTAQNDPEAGQEPEFVYFNTFAKKALLNALAVGGLASR